MIPARKSKVDADLLYVDSHPTAQQSLQIGVRQHARDSGGKLYERAGAAPGSISVLSEQLESQHSVHQT